MSATGNSGIMAALQAYAKTKEGQAAMDKRIEHLRAKGQNKTDAGSDIVNIREMEQTADALIKSVVASASGCSLAPSVLAHLTSATHTAPVQRGNDYVIEISFGGDMHRPSLYPKGYPGGVDNIVALMNNGFSTTRDAAWGIWHNGLTWGTRSRPHLGFLQTAVNDFNASYGPRYGAQATLSDVYR